MSVLEGYQRLRAEHPEILFLTVPTVVCAAKNDGGLLSARDDLGRLKVRAVASTPAVNSYGYRVEPSAFASTLAEFRQRPVMLAYHRMDMPVGRWDLRQEITPDGLILEGWISASEEKIQHKVLDGTIPDTSVGFIPLAVDYDWDKDGKEDQVPVVTALHLQEVSLVPIGADPGARVRPLSALRRNAPPAPDPAAAPASTARAIDLSPLLPAADACRAALEAIQSLGRARMVTTGLRLAAIRGEVGK